MKLVLFIMIPLTAIYSCKNNPSGNTSKKVQEVEVIDETSSAKDKEVDEYTDTVISSVPLSVQSQEVSESTEVNVEKAEVMASDNEKTLPRPQAELKEEKIEQVKVEDPVEERNKTKDEGKTLPRPQPEIKTDIVEQVDTDIQTEPKSVQPGTDHSLFDALLIKYVTGQGKVNYSGLKSEAVKLDGYLDILESSNVDELNNKEKLAFWINAYNAYTIKLILDNYPVASIMDIDGGKAWDTKWIQLDGKTLSLNNIENDIIRPEFKEPRIHFAVNCAAMSCPSLLNKAWTAENLEGNFEKQTRNFINNKFYNDISTSRIRVSRIFEWYATDFGNLINYLNKYSNTLISEDAKIEYLEYDWSLNN